MAHFNRDTYTAVSIFSPALYKELMLEANKIASRYDRLDEEARKDLTKRIEESLMRLAAFFTPMVGGGVLE